MKKIVLITVIVILISGLYGYSQYLKKGMINAVLQYQLDLTSPPESIYAISTYEQSTPSGKVLPKGTVFVGTLGSENGIPVIYFNSIQLNDGKTENFIAKSGLKISINVQSSGVSAKLGKTIQQKTKSNVIGAIFYNSSSNSHELASSVLPKGYALKIEAE